ncbi:sulfate/molybdate ABC transporter ATP-binding protein [Pseudobutyrivibrio ruminis]|uniref:ABC-type quaternary amine transporter n=1 Tax=Pseudobutyrivibrio ruminis DSM 9787 TaxID=1123011 RepID=A0A285SDS7_9FIRM|nr:sulfate ABC transporter ATP-binding protein [Pseudobutyrivibrio ruminis]SOC06021.1 sulfate transport system ATP-binding protein [Pseudobutyrivibrio ruminis DSM 9787]
MYIKLDNVNKTFGNYKASDNVSFEIEKGKLIALLGPSGSGKTTILRMIAGLEHQDDGDIYIDGKLVNGISVQDRGIGFVFQSYALFPYLTVFDNIAYGMKVRKNSKEEISNKVDELLKLVGLEGLGKRYPDQLSGGQRQRVAFARALATEPQVLLLDEPFAAIDAKVRKELRRWLKDTIDKLGITSIFVTHDQDEAVEVADELIITNQGKVEQIGTPVDIYRNPKTAFVAQFIGESVILENYEYEKLNGFTKRDNAPKAAIRPEFVQVLPLDNNTEKSTANMKGKVVDTAFRGSNVELTIAYDNLEIKASHQIEDFTVKKGDEVYFKVTRLYAFDDDNAYTLINDILKDNPEMYYI